MSLVTLHIETSMTREELNHYYMSDRNSDPDIRGLVGLTKIHNSEKADKRWHSYKATEVAIKEHGKYLIKQVTE